MLVIGVATAARTRWGTAHPTSDDTTPARRPGEERPSIGALVRSDLGVWSLVRAVLTVVAVVIGYWLTSDLDPFWTAVTVIIVMQPDLDKTVFKAAQRGLGTLVGVATTTAVIEVVNSDPPIVVIVLIATFAQSSSTERTT
jgi:uncharacterized membrane protein YccC